MFAKSSNGNGKIVLIDTNYRDYTEGAKNQVAESSFPLVVESMAVPKYQIDVQEGQDDLSIEVVLRPEQRKLSSAVFASDNQHETARLCLRSSPRKDRRSETKTGKSDQAEDKILNQTISITLNPTLQSEISFDYSPSAMMRSWEGMHYDDENSFLHSPRGLQWMPSPTSTNSHRADDLRRTSTPPVNCDTWSMFKSSPFCGHCSA